MKKITKKQDKIFKEKFNDLMIKLNAKKSDYLMYKYSLDTNYGKYYLNIHDNSGSSLFSIFGRFEDVQKAIKTGCNRFSGKLNFHSMEMETCLKDLRIFINEVR